MMYDLFSSGRIYLVREPINGNCGIPTLYGGLLDGRWGVEIEIDPLKFEEIYALFTNKRRSMLFVLHVDQVGIDLTKRRLFGHGFRIVLDGSAGPVSLTRGQLKRLVLDGTYEGEWESLALQREIGHFLDAGAMPAAAVNGHDNS